MDPPIEPSTHRKIKKTIWARPQTAWIRHAKGFENAVGREVREIGADAWQAGKFSPFIRESGGGVRVEGADFRFLMELTLRVTTAWDVAWLLRSAHTGSEEQVRAQLEKIPWELILPASARVAVHGTSHRSRLFHEGKLCQTAREFFEARGWPPTETSDNEAFRIDLRLKQNRLEVFLGLAGSPLFKRGYKTALASAASVREDVAATAVSIFSEWRNAHPPPPRYDLIYAPFAGSGGLGWEAIAHVARIPPAVYGRSYAFEKLLCAPPQTREYLRRNLRPQPAWLASRAALWFLESESKEFDALTANARGFETALAHLPASCSVTLACRHGDFFDEGPDPAPFQQVFIALNPPYGERLGRAELTPELYGCIGARLHAWCDQAGEPPQLDGVLFAPSRESAQAFLQALPGVLTAESELLHGGTPIRLVSFRRPSPKKAAPPS